jgi:hypothetical protein
MITANCSHCGKAIHTYPGLAARKKYCSRSCLARSRTGPNAANFKDGRTILRRLCQQCGREFIGAARNRFCSRECFAASRPPTFFTCPQCGRQFGPVDHLGRKFCSKECAYAARSTGRRTFRRTITKARNAQSLVRYYVLAGLLDRPVACEECGAIDRRIEAAHYDYDLPLEVRWLCRSCHVRWDKLSPKNGTVVVRGRGFSDMTLDTGQFTGRKAQRVAGRDDTEATQVKDSCPTSGAGKGTFTSEPCAGVLA